MLAELPFLGRKINLISKCDIRYEGVLYSIDPKESTIALSKVRSFGTEDRVTGRGFVAAKEEIYEYIIFRASDVKDLKLGDSDHLMGLQDPAIIQAVGPKNQRQQQQSGQQQSQGDRPRSGGRASRRSGGRQQNNNQNNGNNQNQQQNNQQMGGNRRAHYGSSRSRGGPNSGQMGNGNGRRTARSQQFASSRNNGNNIMVGQTGQQYNQAGNQQQQRQRRNSSRQRPHQMARSGGQRGGGQQQQDGGARQGQMSGRFRRQLTGRRDSRREPLKFDGDFDFEKSNAEFAELDQKLDKLTIADGVTNDGTDQPLVLGKDMEATDAAVATATDPAAATDPSVVCDLTATPLPAVPAYNKERSFFDSLTCRTNIKPDWRKERRINAETFGIAY